MCLFEVSDGVGCLHGMGWRFCFAFEWKAKSAGLEWELKVLLYLLIHISCF